MNKEVALIYQQNTIGGDVAVFDETKVYKEVGRLDLGGNFKADSVALSADYGELYVNGSTRMHCWQNPLADNESVFAAFDAHTLEERWRVPLVGQVEHFAISPDRRYVYNAHYDRKMVSRVDTQTQEVTPISIANLGGHKVRVSADGTRVYVGSIVWGSLDEIDAEKMKWKRHLTFEDNVRPFALTPDGKTAYVQLSRFHGFKIVDLESLKVTGSVDLPELPADHPVSEAQYPFTSDHGAEITPDGRHAIFLATTGHYAAVYRLPELELVTTIELGMQPSYLTVSKDCKLAYISCRASGELYVVSLENFAIKHVLKNVGAFPQRVCVDH
ncbi:MAG: hypothetical protein AAF358_17095 [Pseudomonadota bacterium]